MATDLRRVFDEFQASFDPDVAGVSLSWLADALERVRRRMDDRAWRAACALTREHPAIASLLRDPFLASARRRDGGIPFAAPVIDHVLLPHWHRPYGDAHAVALHRQSTGTSLAAALRSATGALTAAIMQATARGPSCVVHAIAAGPARELQRVRAELAPLPLREWLRGRPSAPSADLIYSPGLPAFLPDRAAERVVATLVRMLRPGGQLLMANPTPAATERAFIEAVLGIHMVYRHTADWPAVTASLDPSHRVILSTSSDERLTWLSVTRTS